jgi:putative sigma-54 modulation protein
MQIDVTFKQMPHSDALAAYAQDKLGRIFKTLPDPVTAQVMLQVEKYRHIAKVTVNSNHLVIKGKEETNDMYSSLDLVADKLERQVKKYHGKIISRHGKRPAAREYKALVSVISESSVADEKPQVLQAKEITLRPMSVDEAVMQMELLNKTFLLFNNAAGHKLNLIFFRDDGHLGLIEPHLED